MAQQTLTSLFLAALSPAVQKILAVDESLPAHLRDLVAHAQATWPTISLQNSTFIPYLAERTRDAQSWPTSHGAELYLACGCTHGSRAALDAMEQHYFHEIEAALRKMKLMPTQIEETKQILRHQLFVGDEKTRPRIAEYTGRGELRGWLRVTAVRLALKTLRKGRREMLSEDEALFEVPAEHSDPELAHMKEVYRPAFKEAFQLALDALSPRDKNLLRQHIVDRLSIDEIGNLYQVHRATAARWITQARQSLIDNTREHFMTRVRVDTAECESILRLVQSQLDGTIRRRLKTG